MKFSLLLFFILSITIANAQQTVGVFTNQAAAEEGYTFFSPMRGDTSYLIDDCGRLINKWAGTASPGLTAHLLPNGNVLRTQKNNNPAFIQTSAGGNIRLSDWDNNLIWEYSFTGTDFMQHHDTKLMPNGNLLMLIWENIARVDYIEMGKDPDTADPAGLWLEAIFEIEPLIGTDTFNLIWEWRMRDHLIQDFDDRRLNFGVVADHPERINLNYRKLTNTGPRDWWHCNALDYNPERDEIVINSRNNNEMWIIDHSTTSSEAATSSGGNRGKGGDLLYRWGNPEAYGQGGEDEFYLFGAHGNNWVPNGYDYEGEIIFFNNGNSRPGSLYSSIESLKPDLDNNGNYFININNRFGPDTARLIYVAPNLTDFASRFLSNAHYLPNGNVFINEGGSGHLFEVDNNRNIVWDYRSPVQGNTILQQEERILNNIIFRAYKYPSNYGAFTGRDLTPAPIPIEGDSEFYNCISSPIEDPIFSGIDIYFAQESKLLKIENKLNSDFELRVLSLGGNQIFSKDVDQNFVSIDLSHLRGGVYFVNYRLENGAQENLKIVVL
jgi:hypothetical protein